MASIKNLKKDVDYLVSEVISDSYTCLMINDKVNKDSVIEVIEAAIDLRNDLFDKINAPAEGTTLKAYYSSIRKDLLAGVSKLFDELSGLLTGSKA